MLDRVIANEASPPRARNHVGGRPAGRLEAARAVASPAQPGSVAGLFEDMGELDVAARTRVLIVDDHRSFADALTMAIDIHDDLACVGAASSIATAIDTARAVVPDVVLLDIHLPDGDGIDAMQQIRDACPGARVVILTGHTDVEVLARAAAAGASGFLPKESPIGSVISAIRAARHGEMHIEGAMLAAILGRVSSPAAGVGRTDPDAAALTPRETDVLLLMGQGMDPHAIASWLGISLHTCRGYQKAIMAKLRAHSQLEAVVLASRKGLLPRAMLVGQRA
jgi:DNA-binding NarL/FixJ family response regulator